MEHGALRHHRQEGEFDGTLATEIQRDEVVPQRRGIVALDSREMGDGAETP